MVNSAAAAKFEVGPGAFDVRIPGDGLAELEIRASTTHQPPSDELGPRRRLSYVLKRIEWS